MHSFNDTKKSTLASLDPTAFFPSPSKSSQVIQTSSISTIPISQSSNTTLPYYDSKDDNTTVATLENADTIPIDFQSSAVQPELEDDADSQLTIGIFLHVYHQMCLFLFPNLIISIPR